MIMRRSVEVIGKSLELRNDFFKITPCLHKRYASDHPLSRRGNSEVSVAIIGGGAVGVSTAYHLAKAGMDNVVVLEKTELTAGSTWHAAGLTPLFNAGMNMKILHSYSLKLYQQLEEETGQNLGLHLPGSIRLITSKERMDEAKYFMSRQRWNEGVMRLISAEEVKSLCPILDLDGVIGGLSTLNDGHVDPYSLTMAYATGAKNNGAQLYQHAPVTGIRYRNRKWELETPYGTLTAEHIVNCAGFWGQEVNQMIGANIPLIPLEHQFLITRTIPELQNLEKEIPAIRDPDASFYMRQERKGLLIGFYEGHQDMQTCQTWVRNGVPPNFGRELFQPDLERIMPFIELAMKRIPVLRDAEIQTVVNGPITYTPEPIPLIGPYYGFHNMWVGLGFGFGIVQSGGVGRYLAKYIMDGEPPHELHDCDPNRFGNWWTIDFALKKASESYGMNSSLSYPKEERYEGRPTSRNSSLYEILKERGAQFGFHNGWEQPHWFARLPEEAGYEPSFRRTNWFSALQRECGQIMERVGVIDLTPFAKYIVSGPQASEFLDYVTANSLPKVGMARVTHLLTPKGKVFAELTVSRLEENRYFLVTGAGSEFHDLAWLERHTDGFEVKMENRTDRIGVIGVAGPLSRDVLQPITDIDLSEERFKYMDVKDCSVAGIACRAIRISYTGELGWEIYCRIEESASLYKTLMQTGQLHGIDDVGVFAVNALRLEKGFRMWGSEMKSDNNPLEAGLDFFIKLNKKTNFIGKEALLNLKRQGLSRQLVMLKVDASDVDPEGYESVWYERKVIGHTTSGSWSPKLNSSLAFAYVPLDLATAGTRVTVELLGEHCQAVVLPGPPALTEPTRNRLGKKEKLSGSKQHLKHS